MTSKTSYTCNLCFGDAVLGIEGGTLTPGGQVIPVRLMKTLGSTASDKHICQTCFEGIGEHYLRTLGGSTFGNAHVPSGGPRKFAEEEASEREGQ